MKKLGLVGGMGPESTIPYYREIVYGVQQRTGALPPLSIESVSVFEVLRLCREGKLEELTDYLLSALDHLAAAGAEFAALSANTPHIVFDDLQRRSPLPLVSIVEAACDEVKARGYGRIGLMGTSFTMTGDFFIKPFEKAGMRVFVPAPEERALMDARISNELEMGIVREETRRELIGIVERLRERHGIEAVVLGCTELPLAMNDEITPVPCLDTLRIHVQALIDRIVKEK